MLDIRKATTEDIPTIQAMAMEVFPKTYHKILSPEQIDYMMQWMYSTDSLHRQMQEEQHVYYLAYWDRTPAGYLSIQPEEGSVYHLQKLYVMPTYQGMQIGKALFDQAIRAVKAMHPSPCHLRLNVNRHNQALRFYEKMGMKKVDEGDFPIGGGYYMNDYIMEIEV